MAGSAAQYIRWFADLGRQDVAVRSSATAEGFRGASRYYSDRYRAGFQLECRAIKRVRDEIGLRNLVVMVPFCRTPEEADRVLEALGREGLSRGEGGPSDHPEFETASSR